MQYDIWVSSFHARMIIKETYPDDTLKDTDPRNETKLLEDMT